MPHHYRCPACRQDKFLDAATPRPVLQLRCERPRCFGRLEWIASTPGPVAPPLPAAPGALAIAAATTPVTYQRVGSFCSYTVTYDRAAWTIVFAGNTATHNYALTLDTDIDSNSRRFFEPPAYTPPGGSPTLISEFFVFSPLASRDWILPPNPLPENRSGGVRHNELISYGHGAGLTLPIRIQIGRQDENDQHKGSGLIHLMFAHDKDDLQGVFDILRDLLSPNKIGAIYRTKVPKHGHLRYFFLSRSKTPNCLVTELHDTHFRVITLYKINGFANYNKFRSKTAKYQCLYRWDKDKF